MRVVPAGQPMATFMAGYAHAQPRWTSGYDIVKMNSPINPWKVLESRYILRRKWMDVREDRVQLPSGAIIDEFHVLEYPDWVCVIPVTDDRNVVLVDQYRHAIQRVCLELPAGVIDAGETALQAAKRELLEETGYAAPEWIPLGRCSPEPSRHSNSAYYFLARGAYRSANPTPEDSENVRVRLESVSSLPELIEREEIVHGVHAAAILTAVHKGELSF